MRASVHCLLICSSSLLACSRPETNHRPARTESVPPPSAATPGNNQAGAESAAAQEPQALRPIMLQLTADMSGLTNALWLGDYDEMILRSRAIANHADISASEVQRIHDILGPDTANFDFIDEQVHVAAHRMYAAAQARKLDAFLRNLADVQRGCATCHTQFRDRLRTTPPPDSTGLVR